MCVYCVLMSVLLDSSSCILQVQSKTKEETTMQKTIIREVNAKPYPNAANRQYYIDKTIDSALTAAAIIGLVVVVLFLIFI